MNLHPSLRYRIRSGMTRKRERSLSLPCALTQPWPSRPFPLPAGTPVRSQPVR